MDCLHEAYWMVEVLKISEKYYLTPESIMHLIYSISEHILYLNICFTLTCISPEHIFYLDMFLTQILLLRTTIIVSLF